jgi:hypothetical protein
VAATFDPGAGMERFAREQLAVNKVSRERFESLRKSVVGTEELPQDIKVQVSAKIPEAIEAQKIEEVSTVDKIEFFGGVKSEPISGDGVIDERKNQGVIEIKDEDLK